MTPSPPRAVYDCAVFLQGLGNRHGVCRKCHDFVDAGHVQLCVSPAILTEVADVLTRPRILRIFPRIESTASQALLATLWAKSLTVANVPLAFRNPRDPKDQPYTDLAVAAGASYLVTWNRKHLTYLMDRDTPEGVDFCNRFPRLKIVDPPTF